MALNINDPKQVKAFRDQQIQQGRSATEIDSWIRSKVQQEVQNGNSQALESLNAITQQTPYRPSDQSFLGNLGRSIVEPFINTVNKTGGVGYEAYRAVASKGGQNPDPYYDPKTGRYIENPFMSQEQIERASTGAGFVDSLKDAAAIGALAIPGAKAAKGATALEKLLTPALSEVPRGGLFGFAQKDATPMSVLASAGIGGGIGMGFGALPVALQGLLRKAGPKATQLGEKLETGAFVNRLGKPTLKEGGNKFIGEVKAIKGLDASSLDNLSNSATNILQTEGPTVRNFTTEMTKKGIKMDGSKIIKFLENEIEKAPAEADKRVIRSVLRDVEEDVAAGKIDPLKHYELKSSYGDKANWSVFDPTNLKNKANVYGKVYNFMNDELDSTLKSSGFDKFREVNKRLHVASKARNFADKQLNKVGTTGLKTNDLIFGGLGAVALNNPIGAVGGVLAKKVIESPKTMNALSSLLQKGGGGLSQLSVPSVNPNIAKMLNIGSNLSIDQTGQLSNQPQQQSMVQPQMQQQGGQSQDVAKIVNALKLLDPSHASVYDSFVAQKEDKRTEAQIARDTSKKLINDALTQVASNPTIKTGLVASPFEEFKAKLGIPADQATLTFHATISNLKANIAKARAGTSFTPNEEKLLNKYTPDEKDSYQLIITKLAKLQEFFNE